MINADDTGAAAPTDTGAAAATEAAAAAPHDAVAGRNGRTRVLWCIKCLGFGGAERLLVSSAQARDRQRFDYEAAYVYPSKNALVAELEAEGVAVSCIGRRDVNADISWALRLRRLLLERRYDIVHFHLPYTAGIGRLVVRSLPSSVRPAIVTTEHNVWNTNALVVRWMNSLSLPLDRARLAVDEAVRASMPARHRDRTEVVVHGVALSRMGEHVARRDKTRAELGVAPGEVLVGIVANLRPGKGYETLLAAARQLVDEGLPVRFAAVGVGPLEAEIAAVHRRLGLGDRFLLLGGRHDALRVLAAYDVFVLPSHFEGFPVAVMEALALGVPVVASAVGGIPQLVTEGVEGLLVQPGDQAGLAGAVAALVGDPGRRATMAEAARRRASTLDIGTSVRRIEAVYDEVLGR